MKYAVYGENFGVMRLFEDGFDSEEEAWKWLATQDIDPLANWQVYGYTSQAPLEREVEV